MTDPWWKRGACIAAQHLTLDDWVPGLRKTGGDYSPRQKVSIDACKAVCRSCTVLGPCRAEAMATPDERAIRGGLTYEERVARGQARPKRPDPLHGTPARYSGRLRCRCGDCRHAWAMYCAAKKARA